MTDLASKQQGHLNYSHQHWLQRAAEILDEDAAALRQAHTIDGGWPDEEEEVREHWVEMQHASRAVRVEAERAHETSAPQVAECKDPNCTWFRSFGGHSHPEDEKPFIVGMDLAKHDVSDSTVYRCKHGNYFHSLGGVGAPDCGCFDVKTSCNPTHQHAEGCPKLSGGECACDAVPL